MEFDSSRANLNLEPSGGASPFDIDHDWTISSRLDEIRFSPAAGRYFIY